MRIGQFHQTWNGSQASVQPWLTAYTAYYDHSRITTHSITNRRLNTPSQRMRFNSTQEQ